MTLRAGVLVALSGFTSVDPARCGVARASPTAPVDSVAAILDVPFVPQTGVLCGGAAAAMVMRYWGEPGVQAEEFAPLATRTGIRAAALRDALLERGWRVLPLQGGLGAAREQLRLGRPIVALVRERFGAKHYVVLVGADGNRIRWHDPARGPDRVGDAGKFDRAWRDAGNWGLLILPAAPNDSAHVASEVDTLRAEPPFPEPCRTWIEEGIRLARTGERTAARRALETAHALCPNSAAPLAELAGVAFAESDWTRAESLAARAVDIDPANAHACALLATTQFVRGDETAALVAWNRIAEPRIDRTRIDGLERTRYDVLARYVGFAPGTILTDDALRLARRRLETMPGRAGGSVSYAPIASGVANVEVRVLEPSRRLPSVSRLGLAAGHALVAHEAKLQLPGPGGSGDLWTARGRWRARPALEGRVEWLHGEGIWMARGLWERQDSFTPSLDPMPRREERRLVGVRGSRWTAADLLFEVGATYARWNTRGRDAAIELGLERRARADRLRLRADVSRAWSLSGAAPFTTGSLGAEWRTSALRQPRLLRWVGRAGVAAASVAAPLLVWPAAGTGVAGEFLLRAHPLFQSGLLNRSALGRGLAHAGMETQLWPWRSGLVMLGFATFVDVAKPWAGVEELPGLQSDFGVGVRLRRIAGAECLRLDVARGARDGATAVSVGFQLDGSFVP